MQALSVEPAGRRRMLALTCVSAALWPIAAHASDMAILVFFFSLPACLVLVGISFGMAALIKPANAWLLVIPIGPLVMIHLYMLTLGFHDDELVALAIQAAISSTSWFSVRMLRRRGEREMASETSEQQNVSS